jgi:predicted RNA-binding protein Jag
MSRCQAFIAKIAERRGVSVEQLEADIKAKLTAHVDAALAAGRISGDQAAKLKQRIAQGKFCKQAAAVKAKVVKQRGMLAAAAEFLRLDRAALKAQLPGTSLAALATKQGKTVEALVDAMVAPARERLEAAVEAKRLNDKRADRMLDRVERVAKRLAERTFPAKP